MRIAFVYSVKATMMMTGRNSQILFMMLKGYLNSIVFTSYIQTIHAKVIVVKWELQTQKNKE